MTSDLIKYVFVDFDGTLRDTISDPSPDKPNDRRPPMNKSEVVLMDKTVKVLKELDEVGYQLIGVTNQSGVEKGLITESQVEIVIAHTLDMMDLYFPVYFAPYKRTDSDNRLKWRKPDVGMAITAFLDWGSPDLENSLMIGDYKTDKEFADNVGIAYYDVNDIDSIEIKPVLI